MPGANQEPLSENEGVALECARAFGAAGREVVDAPTGERGAPVPGDPWTRYLAAHLEEALAQQAGQEFVGAPPREAPLDLSRSIFESRAASGLDRPPDLTTATMGGSTGPEREGAGAQVGQGGDDPAIHQTRVGQTELAEDDGDVLLHRLG
jgi:hypothetical protein